MKIQLVSKLLISWIILLQHDFIQAVLPELENVLREYRNEIINTKLYKEKDPICKSGFKNIQQANLCARVYRNLKDEDEFSDFHLNYKLLHDKGAKCIKVKIQHWDVSHQIMPCHGVHDPVRTDETIDDYYDYIYISSIPETNKIFVYKHDKLGLKQWYEPLMVYSNIDISTTELDTNEILHSQYLAATSFAYNTNILQVQTILIQEMKKHKTNEKDFVAQLESTIFANLCNQLMTKTPTFDKRLKRCSGYQKPEGKTLDIIFDPILNMPMMTDKNIYPCYVCKDNYTMYKNIYFVSSGPRKGSAVLYKSTTFDLITAPAPVLLGENFTRDELQNLFILYLD